VVITDYRHFTVGKADCRTGPSFLNDWFTRYVKGAEIRGEIEGMRVCRDAPMVSYLLFADDSLILMRADRKNALKLKETLNSYCLSSGQKINEDKSSIFFSTNTVVDDRAEVC
jgi:hypothetical protein